MNVLLLRRVKAKAQNQGKAKARVLPMLILQTKAKRAKKAKKARRVKKVPTPKATRAKKDRRVHTPGPSWKVARVQPKGTQNDRFSRFIFPIPPTLAHPFHRLLPLFPIFLLPTHKEFSLYWGSQNEWGSQMIWFFRLTQYGQYYGPSGVTSRIMLASDLNLHFVERGSHNVRHDVCW